MSIDDRYFDYLQHFGATVSLAEAHADQNAPNQIALRHDVDHDLDLALEMSYWEHEHGMRATYFLLHTARYWTDDQLLEKALQIQDFGHELGLHVNGLTQWYRGEVDDVASHLRRILSDLRDAGINVRGMSAHGDRCCYDGQFINYWCFRELQPSNPQTDEAGKSAEGIAVVATDQQIAYPSTGRVVRTDGQEFELWSISMSDLELRYDAIHVPCDRYFTDSGGFWTRTPDPLHQNLAQGRTQVLMHPIYYRGPQRIYFFLSTARSGSKWLANFLDRASAVTAKHEFSLNHRLVEDKLIPEHRTGANFVELQNDQGEARQLMIGQRVWLEDLPGDYAEANVYLPFFRAAHQEVYPDAVNVHLFRHPADVVRSLLNRNWYDTPQDDRHPILPVDQWPSLSQFEKCCWYVRLTNDELASWCRHGLRFEDMTGNQDQLVRFLRSLQIPVYPRLAADEFHTPVNATASMQVPPYEGWTSEMKSQFAAICGPTMRSLDYESTRDTPSTESSPSTTQLQHLALARHRPPEADAATPQIVFQTDFRRPLWRRFRCQGCSYTRQENSLMVRPHNERHAYLLFAGNGWSHHARWGRRPWKPAPATYYRVTIEGCTSAPGKASIYCLMFARDGRQLTRRPLGNLDARARTCRHSFRVRCDAQFFSVGLYMAQSSGTQWVRLDSFLLEAFPMAPPL